jgi:myosin V
LAEQKKEETTKLQAALEEVQEKYKETKEELVKERVAAKKVAEVVPIVKEVPIIDTELMDKLRDENEKLKVSTLIYVLL